MTGPLWFLSMAALMSVALVTAIPIAINKAFEPIPALGPTQVWSDK